MWALSELLRGAVPEARGARLSGHALLSRLLSPLIKNAEGVTRRVCESMAHPLEEELIGLSLVGGDERSPGNSALSPRTIKRPTNPVATCLSVNCAGTSRLGGAGEPLSSGPSDDGVTLDVAAKRPRLAACKHRANPAPAPHALFPPSQLPSPPCLSPLLGSGWAGGSDAPPAFLLALAAPSKTASAQASPVRRCSFVTSQPERSDRVATPRALLPSMTGADGAPSGASELAGGLLRDAPSRPEMLPLFAAPAAPPTRRYGTSLFASASTTIGSSGSEGGGGGGGRGNGELVLDAQWDHLTARTAMDAQPSPRSLSPPGGSPVALATYSISQSLRLGPLLLHNAGSRTLLPPSLAPSNAAFGGGGRDQSPSHAPPPQRPTPQQRASYYTSLAPPPPLPMRQPFLPSRSSPPPPYASHARAQPPIAYGGLGGSEKGAAAGERATATKLHVGGSTADDRRASAGLAPSVSFAGSMLGGRGLGGSMGGSFGGSLSGASNAGDLGHGGDAFSGRARAWSQ